MTVQDNPFTADFFKRNREKLRQLFGGNAPIVVAANGLIQRSSSVNYKFRQDSNFWYLTGLDIPGAVLVLDRIKEYVILPDMHEVHAVFDGAYTLERYAAVSGVENFLDEKAGWKQLDARIRKSATVATIEPAPHYHEVFMMYTNPARQVLVERLKSANPGIEIIDLKPNLMSLRSVKQLEEIGVIQQAVDHTIDVIEEAVQRGIKSPYQTETEIAASLQAGFAKRGILTQAYEPVVAADANATVIHHQYGDQPLGKNSVVLLDVGAEYRMYAADISRTICFGTPSKRVLQVWTAIREVYEYALGLIRPGVDILAYEQQVEQFMGEKLRALGLIRIIDHDSVRKYYPHAAGHFLGLDVHDLGDYHAPLQENMIITLEPGVYIPEEGIGLRLEDDILVTKTGAKVLSSRLSHELDARSMVGKR